MKRKIFDSHLHIIDQKFPICENDGFYPDEFLVSDYRARMTDYDVLGGAIVSGSFQGYDTSYIIDALGKAGRGFVGVVQVPLDISDAQLLQLNGAGVRAVRFNVRRGGSEDLSSLEKMAHRIYHLAGWHVELYIDSKMLDVLYKRLVSLPSVSVDHLGLSKDGLKTVCKLAEQNIRIKATGFGRVDFDVAAALQNINSANPQALMFGTDLPSTRAPTPYSDDDYSLVADALEPAAADRVFFKNALEFYRMI